MEKTQTTEYEFKILYAFSIIFIVMSHCGGGGFSPFTEFFNFYSFAITPFIFSAGYFYKEEYESNVKEFIWRKFKKLVVPLYLWNFFYGGLTYVIQHFGYYPKDVVNLETLFISPLIDGMQYSMFLCSWFVFPLFITYVINVLVRKLANHLGFRDKEYVFLTWALLFGCVAMLLSNNGLNVGIYCLIIKICLFLPFFEFGVLYRKYKQYDTLGNLPYFFIIIIIALILIFTHDGLMPQIYPGGGNLSDYSKFLFMPYITGMLGTAFWLRVSKILVPSIGKSKYINLIADNTYPIMMNNILGAKISLSIYAILHTYTKFCSDFNMYAFKTSVWYTYALNNYKQIYILHLIFAIIFSILLQKSAIILKNWLIIRIKNNRNL